VQVGLVGARHQVGAGGDQVIHHHPHTADAHRGGIPRLGTRRPDFLVGGGAQVLCPHRVGKLGFVHVHVAAHHGKDQFRRQVGIRRGGGKENRLGGARRGNLQEVCQVGY